MKRNDLYDSIYNELMEKLNDIIFEKLSSESKIIEYDEFYIKIYRPRENEEDAKFVSANKRMLRQFFVNGYAAKNLEFRTFEGANDLRNKVIELKAAYLKSNDELIALSAYNDWLQGYKCVAITITTNKPYKRLGFMAVNEIIKYDINHYKSFYWCECSDRVQELYENLGGFRIPDTYVPEIINSTNKEPVQLVGDGYTYKRYIGPKDNKVLVTKVIYGFNSPEIFNKYVAEHTEEYKRIVNKLESKKNNNLLTEDYDMPFSEIDIAFQIIDIFTIKLEEGVYDYPPYALDVLKKYRNYLYKMLRSDNHFSRYTRKDIIKAYKTAKYYLQIFSPLELHYIE